MLAKISKPNPEDMPALGPQKYPEILNFDAGTADARGESLIGHVKAIIDEARSRKLTTAGFVQRSASWTAVANKAGLFGYHAGTEASLSNTMRNAGGTSSGWSTQVSTAVKDLNGADAGKISAEKCARGENKQRFEPGKYTVILEPAAVSDLIG